jgi:hypothetical protein
MEIFVLDSQFLGVSACRYTTTSFILPIELLQLNQGLRVATLSGQPSIVAEALSSFSTKFY